MDYLEELMPQLSDKVWLAIGLDADTVSFRDALDAARGTAPTTPNPEGITDAQAEDMSTEFFQTCDNPECGLVGHNSTMVARGGKAYCNETCAPTTEVESRVCGKCGHWSGGEYVCECADVAGGVIRVPTEQGEAVWDALVKNAEQQMSELSDNSEVES